MTIHELAARHGRIDPVDLPKKVGPKWGARAFDDEGEEKIFLFVRKQKNAPEMAAVLCGTSKTTIDNAMARVARRIGADSAPVSRTDAGRVATAGATAEECTR